MKISITCEKPGWILYRLAEELRNRLSEYEIRINEQVSDADIRYFVDYSHFSEKSDSLDMGFFTHFEPNSSGDSWRTKIRELDFCVAQSESSRRILIGEGFPEERIAVIIPGADDSFSPKVRLGIIGRTYPSGRKGEHLVKALMEDPEIAGIVSIVAKHKGWGIPVNDLDYPDFYRSIDFLLLPSLVEGGPVPLIEALACGKLAIAPPVGYAPQFEHIEYQTGDLADLKRVILGTCRPIFEERYRRSLQVKQYDWTYWAAEHKKVFDNLHEKYLKNLQGRKSTVSRANTVSTGGSRGSESRPNSAVREFLRTTPVYPFLRKIYHLLKGRSEV